MEYLSQGTNCEIAFGKDFQIAIDDMVCRSSECIHASHHSLARLSDGRL